MLDQHECVNRYRQYRWHGGSSRWGSSWDTGSVVGCAVDLDARVMRFSLNGSFAAPMGVCFDGFLRLGDGRKLARRRAAAVRREGEG